MTENSSENSDSTNGDDKSGENNQESIMGQIRRLKQNKSSVFIGASIVTMIIVLASAIILAQGTQNVNFEFPNGTDSSGVTNTSDLIETHSQQLNNTTYEIRLQSSTQSARRSSTNQINFRYDGDRAIFDTRSRQSRTQVFLDYERDNAVRRTQTVQNNTTQENVSNVPLQSQRPFVASGVLSRLTQVDTEFNQTEMNSGTKVAVYDLTGVSSDAQVQQDRINVSGQISVTENGIVKNALLSLESQRTQSVQSYRISSIGGIASINSPQWTNDINSSNTQNNSTNNNPNNSDEIVRES